jgi:NAD(P)-dependent dehydrogenase (short-subunit alcohol dehydrogenase family)
MGRASAVAFAREGAQLVGCDVAVEPAQETVEIVRAAGGEMVSLQPCRLSDPAECAKLIELAVSEFGRIDVLFNLAARSHFHRLEDFTDEEWRAAQQEEIDLVFYLTRAAWPYLKTSRGVVVNMASLNGSLSFKLLASLAHTTNKAAIIGMTRQLALEGSEHRCWSRTRPRCEPTGHRARLRNRRRRRRRRHGGVARTGAEKRAATRRRFIHQNATHLDLKE